ncbi:hypothetical protein ACFLUA_04520 [Chloroflexota bacterium]
MKSKWNLVKQLEGETLYTLSQRKPFRIVSVLDDRVVYIPKSGSGTPRWSWRKDIEYLVELRIRKGELTPSQIAVEFPSEYNSSYMAAIVDEIVRNR